MAPGVLHEVVAAHEALVAKRATELLLPRVGAVVAGQLVGAGELLTAVGPGAWERPFSWNTQREGETSVVNHIRRTISIYFSQFSFYHSLTEHFP